MIASGLPMVNSQTEMFLNSPNSVIGATADRVRIARGGMGIELFSYKTVRDVFRDPTFTPRTGDYFRAKGATSLIQNYVESGMLTVMEHPGMTE